jgi:hypothetical protein
MCYAIMILTEGNILSRLSSRSMKKLLTPPKGPLKLALYCLVIYVLISLVWDVLLHLPTKGTNGIIFLMFAGVGYLYGNRHSTFLSLKSAFLTCLYFTIPILLLRLLQVLKTPADVPSGELGMLILLSIGIVVFISGFQLLIVTMILSYSSKFGAKQLK